MGGPARRIVVTGHLGHLGSWLAPLLGAPRGVDVRAAPSMDVRSDAARRAAGEADVVFHLAALIDVAESVRDPGPTLSTNVEGTRNLLSGVRSGAHVVFVSSAAVYGAGTPPLSEGSPLRPMSPYAVSKVEGERLVREIGQERGFTWTVVRPFNIYSSRADASNPYAGVVTRFVQRALAGEGLVVFGDGSQTRDLVHASDVAALLALCATHPQARGRTFNAGTGRALSVAQVAAAVLEATASPSRIIHKPARLGDVPHSCADISNAREILGWEPKIPFAAGLREVTSGRLPRAGQ